MPSKILSIVLAITTSLWLASPIQARFTTRSPRKFDAFNRIPCSEELARIDNYGRELRKENNGLAVVVIYGGQYGTREGEVVARLFAIRDRLMTTNAIDRERIVIIDGGFRAKFEIQFWILELVARQSVLELISSDFSLKDVHLTTPAIRTWKYKCDGKH